MHRIVKLSLASLCLAAVATPAAQAQDMDFDLRGVRVEGNFGGDRYRSAFTRDGSYGYGATVGFDGMVGDWLVIGPEGHIWRPERDKTNCTTGQAGTFCNTSEYELGVALRAGVLVTPQVLIFGKGGYVHDSQRDDFAATQTLYYQDGVIIQPPASFNRDARDSGGYQVGGGAEYSLSDMFYVNGQYVYSRYDNRTSRERVMVGIGIRLR